MLFGAPSATGKDRNGMVFVEHLILKLSNPDLRENALHELSKVVLTFHRFSTLVRHFNSPTKYCITPH